MYYEHYVIKACLCKFRFREEYKVILYQKIFLKWTLTLEFINTYMRNYCIQANSSTYGIRGKRWYHIRCTQLCSYSLTHNWWRKKEDKTREEVQGSQKNDPLLFTEKILDYCLLKINYCGDLHLVSIRRHWVVKLLWGQFWGRDIQILGIYRLI